MCGVDYLRLFIGKQSYLNGIIGEYISQWHLLNKQRAYNCFLYNGTKV